MRIEEEFKEPCMKCIGKPGAGPVCPTHYALLFLHYLQNELEYKERKRSAIAHITDPKNYLVTYPPIASQRVTTRTLFKRVEKFWWRAKDGSLYYRN